MIIDGKKIADELLEQNARAVANLNFQPILCDIIVGDDPVSLSFVRIKQRVAEKIGIEFRLVQLPAISTEQAVIEVIETEQLSDRLCGLIVQLQLPAHLNSNVILSAINTGVDVDGLNPQTARAFYNDETDFMPPTAGAIIHIINSLDLNLPKENFLVLGQGELVGKPTAHALRKLGYEVKTADSSTDDTADLLKAATILITGVGKPGLVKANMVAEQVVIIDAGTSESGGSITGDVEFAEVEPKARFITPVPGGVGPVTVAKLMENVITIAQKRP